MLLSAAAVAAMHHHPLLAEHGVALGYVSKLLRVLDTRVPKASNGAAAQRHAAIQPADDISGCALRLLHALCAAPSAGEALARSTPPAVPVLVGAIHWGGAATVLAVETLKRGLSATNRSRDLLVGAALHAGLLQMLLDRLDWRAKPAAATDAPDEVSVSSLLRQRKPLSCKLSLLPFMHFS